MSHLPRRGVAIGPCTRGEFALLQTTSSRAGLRVGKVLLSVAKLQIARGVGPNITEIHRQARVQAWE